MTGLSLLISIGGAVLAGMAYLIVSDMTTLLPRSVEQERTVSGTRLAAATLAGFCVVGLLTTLA